MPVSLTLAELVLDGQSIAANTMLCKCKMIAGLLCMHIMDFI